MVKLIQRKRFLCMAICLVLCMVHSRVSAMQMQRPEDAGRNAVAQEQDGAQAENEKRVQGARDDNDTAHQGLRQDCRRNKTLKKTLQATVVISACALGGLYLYQYLYKMQSMPQSFLESEKVTVTQQPVQKEASVALPVAEQTLLAKPAEKLAITSQEALKSTLAPGMLIIEDRVKRSIKSLWSALLNQKEQQAVLAPPASLAVQAQPSASSSVQQEAATAGLISGLLGTGLKLLVEKWDKVLSLIAIGAYLLQKKPKQAIDVASAQMANEVIYRLLPGLIPGIPKGLLSLYFWGCAYLGRYAFERLKWIEPITRLITGFAAPILPLFLKDLFGTLVAPYIAGFVGNVFGILVGLVVLVAIKKIGEKWKKKVEEEKAKQEATKKAKEALLKAEQDAAAERKKEEGKKSIRERLFVRIFAKLPLGLQRLIYSWVAGYSNWCKDKKQIRR